MWMVKRIWGANESSWIFAGQDVRLFYFWHTLDEKGAGHNKWYGNTDCGCSHLQNQKKGQIKKSMRLLVRCEKMLQTWSGWVMTDSLDFDWPKHRRSYNNSLACLAGTKNQLANQQPHKFLNWSLQLLLANLSRKQQEPLSRQHNQHLTLKCGIKEFP